MNVSIPNHDHPTTQCNPGWLPRGPVSRTPAQNAITTTKKYISALPPRIKWLPAEGLSLCRDFRRLGQILREVRWTQPQTPRALKLGLRSNSLHICTPSPRVTRKVGMPAQNKKTSAVIRVVLLGTRPVGCKRDGDCVPSTLGARYKADTRQDGRRVQDPLPGSCGYQVWPLSDRHASPFAHFSEAMPMYYSCVRQTLDGELRPLYGAYHCGPALPTSWGRPNPKVS